MMLYAAGLLPLACMLKEESTFVNELKQNQILNNEASWKQIAVTVHCRPTAVFPWKM